MDFFFGYLLGRSGGSREPLNPMVMLWIVIGVAAFGLALAMFVIGRTQ